MKKVLLLVFVFVVMAAQVSFAQETDHNACHPGGLMAEINNGAGCQTPAEWEAGWYLGQYINGQLSWSNIPSPYLSMIVHVYQEPSFDNACNEGGVMAGRCTTEWDWAAGWYLTRFLRGEISRENFPAFYGNVLPTQPSTDANQSEEGVTGKVRCAIDQGYAFISWSISLGTVIQGTQDIDIYRGSTKIFNDVKSPYGTGPQSNGQVGESVYIYYQGVEIGSTTCYQK